MDFLTLRRELIKKDFGNMNDRQFEAVTTVNGPLLVLAGAGSGKTTVLVNRIANLVKYGNGYLSDKIPYHDEEDIAAGLAYLNGEKATLPENAFSVDAPRPWEILAITFTNKAAGELKERIAAKLGSDGANIWAGTFHSVCGKLLRYNAERIGYTSHFTVYDTDDQRRLMKELMKNAGIDEKTISHRSVLSAVSSAKDSLVSPEEFEKTAGNDLRQKTVAGLYKMYQQRLTAADAMDFDDMIVNTVRLLEENPDVAEYYGNKFKYIMVDEYQDTNHAQYKLVSLLAGRHGNICVVGDDDQSIYRFRGATIENILNFEDDYHGAKTIRLEQNYRSTSNILDAANAVIGNNRGRKGKNLWTDRGVGEKITVHTAADERAEARFVADSILENIRQGQQFSQHAVLYRMNAQSAALENVFARSGIAYRVIGGMRFYERKEIRDVLAYLNLICNNNDDVRLRRIINEPKRGIGDTTVANAAAAAQVVGIPLFEVFSHADEYSALSRAAGKLKNFCAVISELTSKLDDLSISEILEEMLEKTEYRAALRSDTSPEAADRLANVEEFASTVKQYELENDEPTLAGFLEEIALVSDIDSMENDENRVLMMTVHSAKGLEFDNVFLVGLEEGIFPGTQSIYSGNEEIEEERRLAYVAITRAKKHLTISNASVRMLFGTTGRNLPSRFLREIPEELCEMSAEVSDDGFGYSYYSRERQYGGYTPKSGYGNNGGGYKSGYNTVLQTETPYKSAKYPTPKKETTPLAGTEKGCGGGNYDVGQTVEHTAFGKGTIVKITPMGNDRLIEIVFEGCGTKKLMANYAKLKIL